MLHLAKPNKVEDNLMKDSCSVLNGVCAKVVLCRVPMLAGLTASRPCPLRTRRARAQSRNRAIAPRLCPPEHEPTEFPLAAAQALCHPMCTEVAANCTFGFKSESVIAGQPEERMELLSELQDPRVEKVGRADAC